MTLLFIIEWLVSLSSSAFTVVYLFFFVLYICGSLIFIYKIGIKLLSIDGLTCFGGGLQ